MNQAIRRLLDAAGFQVVTFASGEALLEGKAAASADCLILDVHLPGMSGFELQRRLKERGVHTPFIFVTAHDNGAAREYAERAGAIAYLPKPFIGRMLLDKVCHALRPAS
jgi:FixJ family two-component response regulator